ncbi:MAG: hypothetical protein ACPGO5_02565 [Patescibacteria group bacterium]
MRLFLQVLLMAVLGFSVMADELTQLQVLQGERESHFGSRISTDSGLLAIAAPLSNVGGTAHVYKMINYEYKKIADIFRNNMPGFALFARSVSIRKQYGDQLFLAVVGQGDQAGFHLYVATDLTHRSSEDWQLISSQKIPDGLQGAHAAQTYNRNIFSRPDLSVTYELKADVTLHDYSVTTEKVDFGNKQRRFTITSGLFNGYLVAQVFDKKIYIKYEDTDPHLLVDAVSATSLGHYIDADATYFVVTREEGGVHFVDYYLIAGTAVRRLDVIRCYEKPYSVSIENGHIAVGYRGRFDLYKANIYNKVTQLLTKGGSGRFGEETRLHYYSKTMYVFVGNVSNDTVTILSLKK